MEKHSFVKVGKVWKRKAVEGIKTEVIA